MTKITLPEFISNRARTSASTSALKRIAYEQKQQSTRVEIITTPERFYTLKNEWQDLCDRAQNHSFFQTFSWVWNWWESLGTSLGYSLCIVTVRKKDQLTLVWPLIRRTQSFWTVGSWLGAESGQYADILLSEGDEQSVYLELAWETINHRLGIDILRLENIREDATITPFLALKLGQPVDSGVAPYCDLTAWQDWSEFRAALKGRFRQDLGRRRRRLKEQGKLTVHDVSDPKEIKEVISQALAHKKLWFRERGLYGRFLERPETKSWFINIALAAQQSKRLKLIALKLEGVTIAATMGFVYQNVHFGYFGSFDVHHSGSGAVQTEDTMIWAFKEGIQIYDFLQPQDPHKACWTQHQISIGTYISYLTPSGHLAKFWYNSGLRDMAIRLYHRFPRSFRQMAVRMAGS